jgi:hypothetical protein
MSERRLSCRDSANSFFGCETVVLANPALQRPNASVAALPLAFAAERQYRWTDKRWRHGRLA